MTRRLVILGAGGHGKVVADAARAAGVAVLAFADGGRERQGSLVLGVPVIAADAAQLHDFCRREQAEVIVAIGDNATRRSKLEELVALGAKVATVVHPTAVLAPDVELGAGTVVMAGAIVNVGATIGINCIVNTGARLDHDNVLEAHVHVSPGVTTGGEVRIGEGSHLAVGVCVRNRVSIGAWSIVGVGAAVVKNIPPGVVAYGVPARVIKSRHERVVGS